MGAEPAKPAAAPAADAKPAKKGPPVKMIGIIAAVMIIEAVVVVTIFSMLSPKASQAQADETHLVSDDGDKPKEVPVVEDKFQNMSTGSGWIWDISIAVQVRTKDSDHVAEVLKSRSAEVKEGMRQIVGRADHAMLKEANSEALKRQIGAFLNKIVGVEEKTGDPLIQRVLIPRARGFPAEF